MAPQPQCNQIEPDKIQAIYEEVYQSLMRQKERQPSIVFPSRAFEPLQTLSKLRQKDWKSTQRWNAYAEMTGLVSEMAWLKFMGIPPQEAFQAFLNGLNGDDGIDLQVGSRLIDVKGTMNSELKFKFSRHNRNKDRANSYAFAFVEYANKQVFVTLLGWCERHKMRPYLREDACYRFARFQTLVREGVIKRPEVLLELARQERGV